MVFPSRLKPRLFVEYQIETVFVAYFGIVFAPRLDKFDDFDEGTQRNVSSLCSSLGKRTGMQFTQRRIAVNGVDVVRVWRIV